MRYKWNRSWWGTELSLACDFRIASDNASLGLTETTLAIIPGAGGTRLPRLIGVGRAKELIYTGRRISSQEAKEYGLVEYVVPAERLEEKQLKLQSVLLVMVPLRFG